MSNFVNGVYLIDIARHMGVPITDEPMDKLVEEIKAKWMTALDSAAELLAEHLMNQDHDTDWKDRLSWVSDSYLEATIRGKYVVELENLFDWPSLVEDCQNNTEEDYFGEMIGRSFIGTVFGLSPSGKFYTPWAASNVSEQEALLDELWYEALELVAHRHDLGVESGEGDPCDLFVFKVFEKVEEGDDE